MDWRRESLPRTLSPARIFLALWGWGLAALVPNQLIAQQFWPSPAYRVPTTSAATTGRSPVLSSAYVPSIPAPPQNTGSYSQQAERLREQYLRGSAGSPPVPQQPAIPPQAMQPFPNPSSSQPIAPQTRQPLEPKINWREAIPTQPVGTGESNPWVARQPMESPLAPRLTGEAPPRRSTEEILPTPQRSIVVPPQGAVPVMPYQGPAAAPFRPYAPPPTSQMQPPPPASLPANPKTDYKVPKLEDSVTFRAHPPTAPGGPSQLAPYNEQDFAPTQYHPEKPYDPQAEIDTFGAKKMQRTQRPWVEWFRPQYDTGPIPRYPEIFGPTNVFTPQFMVYGDYRMGSSYIDPGNGSDVAKIANRLNLDMDFKLTATERVHAFVDPFTNGTTFTSVVFGQGDPQFVNGLNGNFQTLFFEGDLGAMVGGAMGIDAPFDLPFTFGRIPLLFQNGIWMEDNLLGAAVAIPAKHSAFLDWSNYDATFFVAIDEVTSNAFGKDDSVAHVFGTHWFIEAYKGYLEVGWAYLDDHTGQGLGYHNIGVSFQRRYFNMVSNALRCIVNVGQDPVVGDKTADGVLLLMENVFITDSPYFKLPYLNLFAGFGRPQSVARNAGAQGVLRNTGLNFETDNLTNFPTLDNTANDTWGAAAGLDLLASDLSQQLIVEVATVQVMGNDPTRAAKGNQYATGLRYQRPLSNSWIFRADAMHGWRDHDTDITGARVELRHKF